MQTDSRFPEAVVQGCSVKKVFLKFSKNPQENTCVRAFFFKQSCRRRLYFYLKKGSDTGVFLWILQKILRTPFFTEHLWWSSFWTFIWLYSFNGGYLKVLELELNQSRFHCVILIFGTLLFKLVYIIFLMSKAFRIFWLEKLKITFSGLKIQEKNNN